jgi:glutamate 5-kinase
MSAGGLAPFRRIVVKIGSALLVDPKKGLRRTWLESLGEDVARLASEGKQVLLVSSGAIALGRTLLKLPRGPLKLEESQAAAAVGQIALSRTYSEILGRHGLETGQILLTFGDTEERRRYLNARATIETLLSFRAVPVINENDTVATAEIRYGDNDRLAARVATMTGADLLVLLSDVDGLYTAAPQIDPEARHIPVVEAITPAIEAMAGAPASELSRGGMRTKVDAGRMATGAGTAMIITLGSRLYPLSAIERGERSTLFKPVGTIGAARKRWIVGQMNPGGRLVVDEGAVAALKSGKSLLPAGVTRVEGRFQRGDAIRVCDPSGHEIGRGLVAYDCEDAAKIARRRTSELAEILGYQPRAAMIHRDDLVLGVLPEIEAPAAAGEPPAPDARVSAA